MSSAATSSGEGLALARATSADAAGDAVGGVAALGASWIETAKVSGPTWTRSRSLSLHASVVRALPLTSVPFRLPRSRTITALDSIVNSACSRLTCSLFGLRWHVSPRPILNFGPARGITFPSGLPRTTISCTFMETVLTPYGQQRCWQACNLTVGLMRSSVNVPQKATAGCKKPRLVDTIRSRNVARGAADGVRPENPQWPKTSLLPRSIRQRHTLLGVMLLSSTDQAP